MSQDTPLHRFDEQQKLRELLDMTQDDLDYLALDEWRRGIANVAFMDAQALKQRQMNDLCGRGETAVLP